MGGGGTGRAEPGFPGPLPATLPSGRGFRTKAALEAALCAQVRPPRRDQGGQRPAGPRRAPAARCLRTCPCPRSSLRPRPPDSPHPGPPRPAHSQDGGLRRHGGHGLQQQMHAPHRAAEAEAAARAPHARLLGARGQHPPAAAQHERQQTGARGAHGHGLGAQRRWPHPPVAEGPARPPPAPDCARPPSRPRPTSQLCGGRGAASCAHARGSSLPTPTSPGPGRGEDLRLRVGPLRPPPLRGALRGAEETRGSRVLVPDVQSAAGSVGQAAPPCPAAVSTCVCAGTLLFQRFF